MSQLPEKRKKAVKYIFGEDDRGDKEQSVIQKKIDDLNTELKTLNEQYSTAKNEYQKTLEAYKKELEKKILDLMETNKKLSFLK